MAKPQWVLTMKKMDGRRQRQPYSVLLLKTITYSEIKSKVFTENNKHKYLDEETTMATTPKPIPVTSKKTTTSTTSTTTTKPSTTKPAKKGDTKKETKTDDDSEKKTSEGGDEPADTKKKMSKAGLAMLLFVMFCIWASKIVFILSVTWKKPFYKSSSCVVSGVSILLVVYV